MASDAFVYSAVPPTTTALFLCVHLFGTPDISSTQRTKTTSAPQRQAAGGEIELGLWERQTGRQAGRQAVSAVMEGEQGHVEPGRTRENIRTVCAAFGGGGWKEARVGAGGGGDPRCSGLRVPERRSSCRPGRGADRAHSACELIKEQPLSRHLHASHAKLIYL